MKWLSDYKNVSAMSRSLLASKEILLQGDTLNALEAALERITQGIPKRIPTTRKLSVRAVEEEANLGNGSGYYYPDFVKKVKQVKADLAQDKGEYVQPEIESVRSKLRDQKRIKQDYKDKYNEKKEQLALFIANHHHLNDQLVQAFARIDELEYENAELKEKMVELRRVKIFPIN